MSQTVAEVMSGPVKIFYAPAGTAIPAALDTDADAILADSVFTGASFELMPFTMAGVRVELTEEVFQHMVDECLGPIGGNVSKVMGKLTLELAQSAPAAQVLGLNRFASGTIAAGAAQAGKTEVHLDLTGSSLSYKTVILSGFTAAATPLSDIIVVPKVAPAGTVGTPYKKGEIRVIPISYDIYEDPAASDAKNRFYQRHYLTAVPTS